MILSDLKALVLLYFSVVRSHMRYYVHHYVLMQGETTDIPGVTIRVKWGKELHYYTIGGHQ
jgi:hypothetical protein